jgi:peptidoglycan/LPS O-acetylase OafA/YrhL
VTEPKRFEVLDSWRGIAACLVALFHLRVVAQSHLADIAVIRHSYLFVDFFFVLSGFVIAANYHSRLSEGLSLWRFALLRCGRLYPLHLATLGICILMHLAHSVSGLGAESLFQPPARSADTLVANLLLIHSLNVFDFPTWNLPSWSISAEFYTYLLYAAAVSTLRDRVWRLLVPVLVLSPVALWMLAGGMDNATHEYGILRCVFGFAAGVLAWKVHGAARLRCGTALELLSVALIVVFVWGAGETALSIGAPAVFAAAVLVFAAEGGALSGVVRRPAFLALGAWSYSIYMVHFPIGWMLLDAAKLLEMAGVDLVVGGMVGRSRWEGDLAALVYFALVLSVASITYRVIEAPGRARFRRLAARSPQHRERRAVLQRDESRLLP